MAVLELQNTINAYVNQADERILRMVKGLFESYYEEDMKQIVAFHPDGKPMTKKEYKDALDTAENQILTGDYISVEEFEQEED